MKSEPSVMRPEWVEARKDREWPVHTLPEGVVEVREPIPSRYFLSVAKVYPGTPAEEAGLCVGDVITHVGGKPITDDGGTLLTMADIQARLLELDADGSRELVFVRDGMMHTCRIAPSFDAIQGGYRFGVGYLMDDRPEILEVMPEACVRVPFSFRSPETGRVLRGFVDFGPVEEDVSGPPRREMWKYVILFTDVDQVVREYDLLERFNGSRSNVYAVPGLLQAQGDYLRYAREGAPANGDALGEVRIVHALRPTAAHTLLHELRHADHQEAGTFSKLYPFYLQTSDPGYADPRVWTDRVRTPKGYAAIAQILEHFYDEAEVTTLLRPFQREWFLARERSEAAKADWIRHRDELAMRRALFGGQSPGDEMRELADRVASTRRAYIEAERALPDADTVLFGSVTVQDVFRLPTLVIERDAEYGALAALRTVRRETGAPILGSFWLEEEERRAGMTASSSRASGTRIDSLLGIETHLEEIGVPMDCLRDLRAIKIANKKTSNVPSGAATQV